MACRGRRAVHDFSDAVFGARPAPLTWVVSLLEIGADWEACSCNLIHDVAEGVTAMQMNPYLSFQGDCEEFFTFYEHCLDGQVGPIFRYAGTPMADHVPADWSEKIMHGSLTVGGQVLMGADVTPDQYERPKGLSLSLQIKDSADAERIFEDLGKGGEVVMPLEKTFWAERFGMLVDRFGIPWIINCEAPDQSQE